MDQQYSEPRNGVMRSNIIALTHTNPLTQRDRNASNCLWLLALSEPRIYDILDALQSNPHRYLIMPMLIHIHNAVGS